MGALPSRESHEGPNTVYFGNNTGVVTFRLPLTPHYFPSPDCLAFKEVYRVRNSQSCKYSFNIREASALLPEAAAKDFDTAQEAYWGPEAEAVDPSVHYHDGEVHARLAENGYSTGGTSTHRASSSSAATAKAQHIRGSLERRRELYHALVIDPTTNALVDTDDEMLDLFLAEQRWRAARDVVRRHRAFVTQEREQPDGAALVIEDVDPAELEAAEAVPPPSMWLRPLPEVVVERMSMADTCAAHRAFRARHGESSETPNKNNDSNDDASRGTTSDPRSTRGNLDLAPVHHPVNSKNEEAALSVLDTQGRQPVVESSTLDEDMLKSYPCFQDQQLPFELDEQYMDGRVHLVAYEGVNYLFAYNPDYVRAMGKTVAVDGSLVEERRRRSGAVQHAHARAPFTTTHLVATRQAEDFDDPNQRRAYEMFQPVYARYYIPVMPVRVLGVDGFIPCRSESSDVRGAPWMRGVDSDEVEEAYEEQMLLQRHGVPPPPVLRACRFIHAVIGDKILNRMSVLGCATFRERCLNAGLPDAIACPLWSVVGLSDIPQLQFQREMELRFLAAIHEIDDGDMRIRDALARQHQWNDYVNFVNSPMYGFIVCAPPERRFRAGADGKLREVGEDNGEAERRDSSSDNEGDKDEEQQQQQQRATKCNNSSSNSNNNKGAAGATPHADLISSASSSLSLATKKEDEGKIRDRAATAASSSNAMSSSSSTGRALQLHTSGASSSSPSSDTESRDEHSGNTSARSAAHNTSGVLADHMDTTKAGPDTTSSHEHATSTATARVKRTRDGQTCIGGCAPPETAEQMAALETAMTNAGISQSCAAAATAEDDLTCLAEPPAELQCAWSFKRRRIGLTEEVLVDPNYSVEDWMPMVNPLTKDAALASMGVRVSLRGRVALVRYSARAMREVVYYLSQASAPIFCLPYVGPPQQCPNVYLENVLRAPVLDAATSASASTTTMAPSTPPLSLQNGLQPPTPTQIQTAMAAYRHGRVSCYVFVNLNDRASNPPTSCVRNHRRDDMLMAEPEKAGITSKLILAQIPIKADARCALEFYRKSLVHGPALMPGEGPSPFAEWPALLDAPLPCDGDVLVVCPRTHRWIRVTTLILLGALLAVHRKVREKEDELPDPVPVLDLFTNEHFAKEVEVCYEALTHKNTDSEGMQCHMLHMRNFFSYNGIVELVLDRLRAIIDSEGYEDKDDEGWLVLHEPSVTGPGATPTTASSLSSTPTTATAATPSTTTTTSMASSVSRVNFGPANSGAAAFTSQKYMESGSYFIWSFALAGQRFFFGTKPRFIRLALQRQKQNQRRRLKRKERDGVATGNGSVANASADTLNTNNSSNRKREVVAASGEAPRPNETIATPTTAVCEAGLSAAPSAHSALSASSHSSASGSANASAPFAPQTTFTKVPPPAASSNLPITTTDRTQLVKDAAATHGHHDASQHPPHPHHSRATASTTHIPYAPLHLSSEDHLANNEANEMRECRQLHRQWLESRGVLVASSYQRHHELPLLLHRPDVDTSSLTLSTPQPGPSGCRRRWVVPIAPHGIGRPTFMNCAHVAGEAHAAVEGPDNATANGNSFRENEEVAAPVQRPGLPRVVDAETRSYRWNPYRVG